MYVSMFIAASFAAGAAQVSVDRWADKEDVVYIYDGILLGHKKSSKTFPSLTAWMDPEDIMLDGIKSDGERQDTI